MNFPIRQGTAVLCASMLLVPLSVVAQTPESEQQEKRAPRANRMLEEVVVTAQKREEDKQDVPISIQAFSGEKLDAMGIEEPKALQLVTPGLAYNTFAGYSLIYIRGVGTDAFIPSADASVATYIDNVYYPFGHGLASALGEVRSVEVLKGPQGTLFGRNSTGGAIHVQTKQPDPDAAFVSAVVTAGQYKKRNVRAYANLPLTEKIAMSISGLKYTEDQYYDRHQASPRTEFEEEESEAFSLRARWSSDSFDIIIGHNEINTKGEQSMWLPVKDPKPLGESLGVVEREDYENAQDGGTYIDSKGVIDTIDAKYFAPWFDVRVIGAIQDIESPALADYDGSDKDLAYFEAYGQFADTKTAEVQFLSNGDFGPAWLSWIAGAYFIESEAGYDPLYFSLGSEVVGGAVGGSLPGGLGELAGDIVTDVFAGVVGDINLDLRGVLATRSTAYFFQATADITPWMSLTLGGRQQEETRELVKSTSSVINSDGSTTLLFDFGSGEEEARNFSPRAVIDFKVGENHLFYMGYSKGFKSGTYNIIAIYQPPQYIEPEDTTSYEIGYKSTWLDGALTFNVAAFENQIDNLQVQSISLTSGGAVRFETAGSAEIKGAEYDILWQVLPETLPGLVISSGAAYLNGKSTSYEEGSGFDEDSGLFFDGSAQPTRDFTGNEQVRTPEWSGTFGVNYNMELGDGNFEVAGDAYYNSGFYFSPQNTEDVREDDYYVTNARMSYLYYPWNLRVTAYGKNLNKAKHHYTMQDLDFGTAALLAPKASIGLRLNWEHEF